MEGTVFTVPPSTVAVTVADEKRWWEEQLSATASITQRCRRIDLVGPARLGLRLGLGGLTVEPNHVGLRIRINNVRQ
ncbi:hypothetical protein V6N13_077114 [Hibiscus sabdariffa]|uniref:Uncharacterized protein n=1 Tax=Hibiscus sabdariffa TaxID=183260 RepID=A0ABR2CMY4_9ROSI